MRLIDAPRCPYCARVRIALSEKGIEHETVVVDLVRYAGAYDVSTLTGNGPLTLDRWIIDPATGKVAQQRLDDRPQEFPRTDERVTGRPHRYGYSAVIAAVGHATISPGGDFADEAFSNALLKHDLAAGAVQAHEFGKDATAGEAVFAPAAPDAAEDDGYVMAYIHNPDLTHGFPQFTRSSAACHQATLELADHIKTKIG